MPPCVQVHSLEYFISIRFQKETLFASSKRLLSVAYNKSKQRLPCFPGVGSQDRETVG